MQAKAHAARKSHRFKVNPVEVAIFALVGVILGRSVYHLFQERETFQVATLKPMEGLPTVAPNRTPAAFQGEHAFLSLHYDCDRTSAQATQAQKLRLQGGLCAPKALGMLGDFKISKSSIRNLTNDFTATIFPDTLQKRFSTDYIPLAEGKNSIEIEFQYAKEIFKHTFEVDRKIASTPEGSKP
jgi:hypothetical protein